jgi:hypothetical protein
LGAASKSVKFHRLYCYNAVRHRVTSMEMTDFDEHALSMRSSRKRAIPQRKTHFP